MLREMKLGIQRYWYWTSAGPIWHSVASLGGPTLALFILIGATTSTPSRVDAPGAVRLIVTSSAPPGVQARVVRVIDGDSVEVDRVLDGRATVQYIGIETPDTEVLGQPEACYGQEASNRNKELVEGKTVFLERDVSETDHSGRLLRYVYVENGQMVNEFLVAEGFGQTRASAPDVKHHERFSAA